MMVIGFTWLKKAKKNVFFGFTFFTFFTFRSFMMRYQLEKYYGTKSRHACPSCGAAREFVRYVDENGNYLDDRIGKCNRDSKCGYHKKPKEFFEENPGFGNNSKPLRPRIQTRTFAPADQTTQTDFINFKILSDSLGNYHQNSFVRFLLDLFPDDSDMVWQAVNRYFLGTSEEKVIFWQIDWRRRIRTGKLMLYNSATGKRIAETFKNSAGETIEIKTNWIHAQLKRRGLLKQDFNLKQCYFGEHLTATENALPIAIVEAEKTAVIASIFFPKFVWLATGGKQNLNTDKLKEFSKRQIIAYPDADGFDKWQEIAAEARGLGLSVKVSSLIDQRATEAQKANGFDLADYLIGEQREINEFNEYAELYNSAVMRILSSEHLQADFETILDEQKAVLIIDGGLGEAEAELFIRKPENLRQAAMLAAN
jgi:hypothetical protein